MSPQFVKPRSVADDQSAKRCATIRARNSSVNQPGRRRFSQPIFIRRIDMATPVCLSVHSNFQKKGRRRVGTAASLQNSCLEGSIPSRPALSSASRQRSDLPNGRVKSGKVKSKKFRIWPWATIQTFPPFTFPPFHFHTRSIGSSWGPMFLSGDTALQAACGGCDPRGFHQILLPNHHKPTRSPKLTCKTALKTAPGSRPGLLWGLLAS